jgi:Peptide N-acetyl-beta-D-glucosaminyl asparaginase amidase A
MMLSLLPLLLLSHAFGSYIPYTLSLQKEADKLMTTFKTHTLIDRTLGQGEQRILMDEDFTGHGSLDVFQVYKPVSIPEKAEDTQHVLLFHHSFGNSYGKPYVGNYTPPRMKFTNVHTNLTVTSRGRQFDRLGILYFGDVEVFRTSTAEPSPQGIVWSYCKEMTQYLALWQTPQKIIFDLGNLVNDIYTGSFDVTLTATFFTIPNPVVTADLILPISAQRSSINSPSAFILPSDNATTMISIPPNTSRAIVSIAACGQATEEFWYSNVPSSLISTFENTTGVLYGFSSFREVQLYIDGMLAGVVWPFPIIFTGGIAPGLWRPLVGIDAFDLREFEIDLAPFIPLLIDGKQHSFKIQVVGLDDTNSDGEAALSKSVGHYWVVTGKVFLFLDPLGPNPHLEPVPPMIHAPAPTISIDATVTETTYTGNQPTQNETLGVRVTVSREIRIFSLSGIWRQSLYYSSYNLLTNKGLNQLTRQGTFGDVQAIANQRNAPPVHWSLFFTQPLTVLTNLTIFSGDHGQGIGISALVFRMLQFGCKFNLRPDISVFSLTSRDSELHAYQRGKAKYSSQTNKSYSFGSTLEEFDERRKGEILWQRNVEVVNGSIVKDGWDARNAGQSKRKIWSSSLDKSIAETSGASMNMGGETEMILDMNARSRIGRGPGLPKGLPAL